MDGDRDLEIGSYKVGAVRVAGVRFIGACCYVFIGLVAFTVLVSYVPVSGVTEAPAYAKSLLYMSLGCVSHSMNSTPPPSLSTDVALFVCSYHFDDVQEALSAISPPPPSF